MLRGDKKTMEAFRLHIDDVDAFQNDICVLLRQSFEKSFPSQTFEYDEFKDRIEKVKQYMLDNKAVIYGVKDHNRLVGFIWFFKKAVGIKDIIHINHFIVHEQY